LEFKDASGKKVILPSLTRIGKTDESVGLYELEERLQSTLEACAREWLTFMNLSQDEFWNRGIPQALFDALTGYGSVASEAAAYAFLKSRGYTVTRNDS